MLIDRYEPEDVFARVPELAEQTDPVLVQLDRLLEDDGLYQQVRGDRVRRSRLTPVHGRPSTPGEVILRLLVVQHLYGWSSQETVQRVADALVLRWFCRVSFRRTPDATTVLRWARTVRPTTLHALIDRVAVLATQAKVTQARKVRVDAPVVETPIHYPTDRGLFGDSVRVLTRVVLRAKPLLQDQLSGTRGVFRNRMRATRRTLQALYRVVGRKAQTAVAHQRPLDARLIQIAEQTLQQARTVRQALVLVGDQGHPSLSRARERGAADRLQAELDRFLPLGAQVIHQARTRVREEKPVPAQEKRVSLFEPHTRVLRRHKTGIPVEFGRHVVLDEVEGGIVTRLRVLGPGEVERHELASAVAHHQAVFGHPPHVVTADHGCSLAGQAATLRAVGVRHVVVPTSGRPTTQQRAHERTRAWKRRSRWRAGIEGRIHRLRRDYGVRRCRSHGEVALLRDVGWGILASDLDHIARRQAA
jgi:IS5 family transposase